MKVRVRRKARVRVTGRKKVLERVRVGRKKGKMRVRVRGKTTLGSRVRVSTMPRLETRKASKKDAEQRMAVTIQWVDQCSLFDGE